MLVLLIKVGGFDDLFNKKYEILVNDGNHLAEAYGPQIPLFRKKVGSVEFEGVKYSEKSGLQVQLLVNNVSKSVSCGKLKKETNGNDKVRKKCKFFF